MTRVLLTLLIWMCSISARAANIEVLQPDHDQVVIHGRIGDDGSFSRRITLHSDADSLVLVRSTDLTRADGRLVSRSQIQMMPLGNISLSDKSIQDVDIKVTGIKVPGVYKGFLSFLDPKQKMKEVFRLPFEIDADAVTPLETRKGLENAKLQFVNCQFLGCVLSNLLQPSATRNSFNIYLNNIYSQELSVDATLAAAGQINWEDAAPALMLKSPVKIEAKSLVAIPIDVSATHLSPDHYLGDIQLRAPGQDNALKIPLEINVKAGPMIPLCVILLGILMGRLIKYMKDKGTPQANLLLQLRQLQQRAAESPADEELLMPLVMEAEKHVFDLDLSVAQTEISTIENLMSLLARLRYLEHALAPRESEAPVQFIFSLIAEARQAISLRSDPTAIAQQIEQAVTGLPPKEHALAPSAMGLAKSIVEAATFANQEKSLPQDRRRTKIVAFFTGFDESARAELTLWFLRPLLWLLLLMALSLVGFQQLYLKNATFGAYAFDDYFGLFIWAISADVASRTLGTLK